MPDYFKPLRRKIGVVTLVLACVFAAMWVRSGRIQDVVRFGPGGRECIVVSFDGRFSIWVGAAGPNRKALWMSLDPVVSDPFFGPQVPYFFLVIPLAAISAWLLLSKPRSIKNSMIEVAANA